MTTLAPAAAPLSPHWAFVVQLREGTPLTPEGLQGRVEHITSGQVTDFGSLMALLAFIENVLTPPMVPPPSAEWTDCQT
jgi:hypothetical protein